MNYIFIEEFYKGNVGFEVFLTSHCNLKCRGCMRYCNIAKPEYYPFEKLKQDFLNFKRIKHDNMYFCLTGGEPLLHPNFLEIAEWLNQQFPTCYVVTCTNGMLFTKQTDEWYRRLASLGASFTYTKYPTDAVDYDRIHELGEKYGIDIVNINSLSFFTKNTDPLGTRNELDTHHLRKPKDNESVVLPEVKKLCICGGDCPAIFNGKLYTCGRSFNIKYLNKKFNLNYPEDSYIEVSSITSPEELFTFCRTPGKLCSFCANVDSNNSQKVAWSQDPAELTDYLP